MYVCAYWHIGSLLSIERLSSFFFVLWTNARMGRVDRNWTKSGGRPSPMARGFVSG